MARKPNYRFDRLQKDRAKAQKKAERLEAKRNKSSAKGEDGQPAEEGAAEVATESGDEVTTESNGT